MIEHPRAAVLAVVLAIALAARAGDARADDVANAEQLFLQGRELAATGDWAGACKKFEASYKLDPALGTILNLAQCNEKLGNLATAWGRFREAMTLADRSGETKREQFAREHAEALLPRLPRMQINLPTEAPTGLEVTRDGARIDPSLLGTEIYVDPGEHEIAVTAAGHESYSTRATAEEARLVSVDIPQLEREPRASGAPAGGELTRPLTPDARGATRRWIGLATGGAGVVAVGVGLAFGLSARSSWDRAFDDGECNDQRVCSNRGQELTDSARTKATIANVVTGAGIVMAGAGAFLFFTAPRDRAGETVHAVTPLAGSDMAGLAVSGRF